MKLQRVYALSCASAFGLALTPQLASAQSTAPSSITPSSLRPDDSDKSVQIDIPEAAGLEPPAGAGNLTVTLDAVSIDGGFPELASTSAAILAPVEKRSASLADIYRRVAAVEAAYARAGFVLARVVVPPQSLRDGGTMRIVVIDGFIEDIDLAGVPARVRRAVGMRVEGLKGRRHLKLSDIEQPLLIANDVPGLTLSSTLMRGGQAGGTRLVLAGKQHLVSGGVSASNQLDPSLGTWGVNAQLSLNSALGMGEQLYGFASSGYDLSRLFQSDAPVRVYGGGLVLPIGDGRLTLNPEATFSSTRPRAEAGIPQTLGKFRRLSFRVGDTVLKTRADTVTLNATAEQIDETNALPGFGVTISHDRYMAARIGAAWRTIQSSGATVVFDGQFSQGLGGLGALRPGALPVGTSVSRQGASLDFTKLALSFQVQLPLSRAAQLTFITRAQSSFGKPLFRAEQTALEGGDALSAYVGGVTAVDEAVTSRVELAGATSVGHRLLVRPYLFVAGGIGRLDRPTALEPGNIAAGSAGAGLRVAIGGTGISLAAEYAHGFADYAPLRATDRGNLTLSLRF